MSSSAVATQSDLLQILQSKAPYSGWSAQTHQRISAAAPLEFYPAGHELQSAGQPAHAVYVICTGAIIAVTPLANGDGHPMTCMLGGAAMGVSAMFGQRESAQSWIAVKPTYAWRVPREVFLECFWADRAMAESVLDRMTALLRLMAEQMACKALLDAKGKVTHCLLAMTGHQGLRGSNTSGVVSLSQNLISQMAGITRQSTSSAISAMEKAGLVRRVPEGIEVLSVEGLRRWGGLD